jgi:hypothetical protein
MVVENFNSNSGYLQGFYVLPCLATADPSSLADGIESTKHSLGAEPKNGLPLFLNYIGCKINKWQLLQTLGLVYSAAQQRRNLAMPGLDDELGLNDDETTRLKELREALQSEFLDNEAADPQKSALNDIEDLKADFLNALRHTVRHSQSDALKAKVSMWGYDKLLDQGKANADPIRELIEGMEGAREKIKDKSDSSR